MLTRFRFRKDFRVYTRFLSDKASEDDTKLPEIKRKPNIKDDNTASSNTEKIQNLLKNMMSEKDITITEYKERFTVMGEPQKRVKQADEIEVKTELIEKSLTDAASEVAKAIGGDTKQTEAELLSKVLGKINQTSTNLSDLILGMKVDRTKDTEEELKHETRGQQVKRVFAKAKAQRKETWPRSKEPTTSTGVQTLNMDIFNGQPLGIFKNTDALSYGTKLDTWDSLKQRELTLTTAQPPTNYFQKMILWTKQGKVWKFPINNEQGLEEEESVHFSEHVFLETHLEGWCPNRGPIRHFMELVCVGLSKNPFYTIHEKKEHILWYKEYFVSKKSVLSEVGAWDVNESSKSEISA